MDLGRLNTDDPEGCTKEFVLQAKVELTEVLNEINWKHHTTKRKEVDRRLLLRETIDVLKFLVNIWVVWGFTPKEILDEWIYKTIAVNQRLDKEIENCPRA